MLKHEVVEEMVRQNLEQKQRAHVAFKGLWRKLKRRQVPTHSITIERPVPSTGDAPDVCTLEVECEMDDGSVYSAQPPPVLP